MHNHTAKHACHSDRNPVRGFVGWATDKNKVCYMTIEQVRNTDGGCGGCQHATDGAVRNNPKPGGITFLNRMDVINKPTPVPLEYIP